MDSPIRIFPILYSIDDFIDRNHPIYHPATREYTQYWERHERYCLEGKWGKDGDRWRYMPGFLYYYINLCKIISDTEGSRPEIEDPLLRDVEWILSYGWLAARQFSGFKGDKYFTCNRLVAKLEQGKEFTPKEEIQFNKYRKSLLTPEGKVKKYVNAIDYLYETKPEPLGEPLYENEAKNLFVLGPRGFGKSYFTGNAVIGHEYNFYGKKAFDSSYLVKPSPVEIFVGAGLQSKSSELLEKFELTQEYLKTGPGSWGEDEDFKPGYFYNNSSGSLSPNNAKNPYRHYYEVREGGVLRKKGSRTKIIHGTWTTENPQAAVGTRPTVIVAEETGLIGNLLGVHGANETAQIRKIKFGSSLYIGTGGNMEKITESKIIFEDAEAFEFIGYEDIFEKRGKKIGLFLPSYYVDNTFKNDIGNTDIEGAFKQEQYERDKRKRAANQAALTEYLLARPLVPSEMFLSSRNNLFPVAQLKERYVQLSREQIVKSVGYFEYADKLKKEVKWVGDSTLRPIEELNLKSDSNTQGAWIIYEHPPYNKPLFALKRPLFKVVFDPIKDDEGGQSFASILIYKGFIDPEWQEEGLTAQDDLVGEYIGRPAKVEDTYEMAIQAALYYGARILPETNLPDFVRYCRIRGLYHILQPSPWEAISKVIKNPSRKYEVGVTMSTNLKIQCNLLISDMLITDWKSDGEVIIPWLFKIKSKRLLLELINFGEGNYDHVSALRLLALWNANDVIYYTTNPEQTADFHDKWNKYASTIAVQKMDPFYVYRN